MFPYNSRFGAFHSRLGQVNSRFRLLPEFSYKSLIYLTVFAAQTAVARGKSMKFPVSTGKTGNFTPRVLLTVLRFGDDRL